MDADHITRFARVDFRNDDRLFGIKDEDRFLHIYVIGKTGTGKSTLIETMALQDLWGKWTCLDNRGKSLSCYSASRGIQNPIRGEKLKCPAPKFSQADHLHC